MTQIYRKEVIEADAKLAVLGGRPVSTCPYPDELRRGIWEAQFRRLKNEETEEVE